jgi:hypothetical protein
LAWIKALTGFDQPSAGDLQQIFVVLAAMHESAGQGLCQPKMRGDYLIENPLAFGGSCRLGRNEEVVGTFSELFAGDLRDR